MKKLFIMFAIAGAMASCNDSGSSTMSAEDSARMQDSINRANEMSNPPMNSGSDTMNNMMGDTMNKGMMGDTMNRSMSDSTPK